MSGTSLDAVDVALVKVTGRGLAMLATYIAMHTQPLDDLRPTLLAFARGEPAPASAFVAAARRLGEIHAGACAQLVENCLPKDAALHSVVAHGQTIVHLPDQRLSWQLFDPWPIARQLNVPVRYDLRQADLIAAGQGAPITPLSDWMFFRPTSGVRVIVNLGGVCNLTTLTPDWRQTAGADVSPCNLLLDAAYQRLNPAERYDRDGELASTGIADPAAVDIVRKAIDAATANQQSLGREQYGASWIDGILASLRANERSPADILAAVVRAAGLAIASAIHNAIDSASAAPAAEVYLAGGGARHPLLRDTITNAVTADVKVGPIETFGMPAEAREAAGFAVLGALCDDGVPITLPAVTGAQNPGIAGVVTPTLHSTIDNHSPQTINHADHEPRP